MLVAPRPATGLGNDRARRTTRIRALQTVVYWIQLFIAVTVIQFPLTVYAEYYREKHYDLLSFSGFSATRRSRS